MRKFLVDKDYINSRLDKWFKRKVYDAPQSFIEKNIRRGNIKVNKINGQEPDSVKNRVFLKVIKNLFRTLI